MTITCRVGCWSKERDFYDRDIVVRTDALAPLDRYTLEYLFTGERELRQHVRKLRHLFTDQAAGDPTARSWVNYHLALTDYFERPDGQPVTLTEILREREGNPNIIAVPGYLPEKDVEFLLSENSPVPADPLARVRLSQGDIDCLAYFVRDASELRGSRFRRSSAPSLASGGGRAGYWLENLNEESLRSFVTIFRRLYMESEPGNFVRACDVYGRHFLNERITGWVEATKIEYARHLESPADRLINAPHSFTAKCLLDVFIYTRYAHQPNAKRVQQFGECLAEVGDEHLLTFMFCTELLLSSIHIVNVLPYIEQELGWYLSASGQRPSLDCRPLIDRKGGAAKELVDASKQRRIHDYAVRLGEDLWRREGMPADRLPERVQDAERLLRNNLEDLRIEVD